MKTCAIAVNRSLMLITVFLIVGLIICSGIAVAEDAGEGKRISITTQSTKLHRDKDIVGHVSEDEFNALVASGKRATGAHSAALSKAAPQRSQSPNSDFWFYTADVVLFNDDDRDGYYHGIDLLFDAGTYFTFAEVYAVVYLSLDGGPWNEYAATENFTLFGASSDDEYVLVTELLAGYPTGSYDILIELFDAYDDSFLAWLGPEDTSELAYLPLEDADRDAAVIPDVIVINRRGGGSFSWFLIIALGLATLVRGQRARRGQYA